MAWASSCVAPWRRTSVSTSWPGASGRAGAFVLASYMVAYPSAWWAGGWSCNNPGYAAFFNRSSTTFDHSSLAMGEKLYPEKEFPRGHDQLAVSLGCLGVVLKDRGDYARARVYHERALAMDQKLYPEKEYLR